MSVSKLVKLIWINEHEIIVNSLVLIFKSLKDKFSSFKTECMYRCLLNFTKLFKLSKVEVYHIGINKNPYAKNITNFIAIYFVKKEEKEPSYKTI